MNFSAIWWIRRDMRLRDNATLQAALQHERVIPVFVRDPNLLTALSARRQPFLWNGLRALESSLRRIGSYLIVRTGQPKAVLAQLLHEYGLKVIYAEEDYTPYARHRDTEIAKELPLNLVQGQLVNHPMATLKANGKPYSVFTPFSKNWRALIPSEQIIHPAPNQMTTEPYNIPSEKIPIIPEEKLFPAGEIEAHRRLNHFISEPSHLSNGNMQNKAKVYTYANDRNHPGMDGTSSLSPYLHFGMLSLRETVHHARQAISIADDEDSRLSAETWLNELIWREFYIHVLYHFPQVRERSFRSQYEKIRWINNPSDFDAWKLGKTGYPIVDAGMRQLQETGWMHNRARMIVASFLVKDLLIDWRWGEAWFMENLLDADLASNNGGWQWSAGVGTDAAPYFRIFNPILQSKKFDPHGNYIRRWVPELADLSDQDIHAPWERKVSVKDYPLPIIDHKFARERTLEAYQKVRN
ncbi:MAG: deoxyribodipyrimidine photo-lyase [Anaerolineae bacterium]|nr:deoxyribodipyrimidine photo-lyase [Anaerolineae bacterium]